MAQIQCSVCGKSVKVIPSRLETAKFCSHACRGKWRAENYVGENNPNYRGGKTMKSCECCGKKFGVIPAREQQKFCSKPCADKAGFRYSGEDHHNYRPDARRKNRGGSHRKWVAEVVNRDKATCQKCGATGVELHAHHILSFRDHPELREVVSNGVTLCHSCHWDLHAAQNEKAVNSVKPLPASRQKGNTEPSSRGNPLEGVTTRGRAYRRWEGRCEWCDAFISKRLSDMAGKAHFFCSSQCSGSYIAANRTWRPTKNPTRPRQ